MLRQMASQPVAPSVSGGSAATAAHALAQMAEIQKRIARGDTDGAQFLSAKLAESRAAADASGATGTTDEKSLATTKGVPNALWAAIGGVAVMLLVAALMVFNSSDSRHSISGTIMLDRQPLPNVEIAFQLKSGNGDPIRVTTTERGTFSIDAIPAGDYAIFLSPTESSSKVPKRYLTPESTPFRLKLTKDRSDLRMIASSGKRK
jgi:hypothetical protein